MINRLIDVNPIINNAVNKESKNSSVLNNSIEEYAISFIEGMSENQLRRFKKMLENGIECGTSVANAYEVNYEDFINEVKKLLKVGV